MEYELGDILYYDKEKHIIVDKDRRSYYIRYQTHRDMNFYQKFNEKISTSLFLDPNHEINKIGAVKSGSCFMGPNNQELCFYDGKMMKFERIGK